MTSYLWKILEVFAENDQITQVKYYIQASNGNDSADTEGYHTFSDGIVVKSFAEIKEEDLIRWVEQDTTQNEVNIIKLNLEKQLEALKNSKKSELPWLVNTFTIE